ncbi:hypothetical protein HMPREF1982_02694 [Clostridiales bacterium oral taxon 876 str. F0540]|nr:hypothetical protein HMPREF1982_02694 [Clostridiales bacterium oral taxon 876 str. F0540]
MRGIILMKRQKRIMYILFMLFVLFIKISIPSANIINNDKNVDQNTQTIASASLHGSNIIDYKQIDNMDVTTLRVNIDERVESIEIYIITICALYFLINNPPRYIEKIIFYIRTVYFNGSKYKENTNTF